MRVLNDSKEISASAGTELGVSEWITITQERINQFADATGDQQWIHVDPEKAAAGPFGRTIAHGYLTLSLLPLFRAHVFAFAGEAAKLNYGLNKVRFMSPVPVDSKLRARIDMVEVNEIEKGQRAVMRYTIEIDGVEKPACVAEAVVLLLDS